MLQTVGVVMSIGLADSVNPSTVALGESAPTPPHEPAPDQQREPDPERGSLRVAGGLVLIGAFALLLGATGLIGEGHGAAARTMRQLHSSIKL